MKEDNEDTGISGYPKEYRFSVSKMCHVEMHRIVEVDGYSKESTTLLLKKDARLDPHRRVMYKSVSYSLDKVF
jgi:hypothetical protein